MLKKYSFYNIKITLILCTFALSLIGNMAVGSVEPALQKKHLFGIAVGIFFMIVVMLIDYHTYTDKLYILAYVGSVALLLAVRYFGTVSAHARRWLIIGGVKFQPSELTKILLIVFFAKLLDKYREKINSFYLIIGFVLIMLPVFLILKQPNLSTSIVTFIIFLTQLFIAGLSYKLVGPAFLVLVPSVLIFFEIVKHLSHSGRLPDIYQLERIMAFLEPSNPKYSGLIEQQNNSVMAIGSGQLLGKGLNNNIISSVKKANFVSEVETDFIFSVIGEEIGFVGCVTVVILYLIMTVSLIMIAKKAKDLSGRLLAIGMSALIGFQSFLNMGVALRVLPNTGVTLPFISFGLTSMLSLYIGIGIALNVGLQPDEMNY